MGIEMTKWFDIIENVATKKPEVYIYGVIGGDWNGDGTSAKSFREEVDKLGDVDFDIHLNSPGGSVYDGIDIYNYIKRKRRDGRVINIYVSAQAASIASMIAMAGDTLYMPSNAVLMIHDPTMWANGGEKEMARAITRLRIAKQNIMNAYADKTGLSLDEIKDMMSEETWLRGEQAVELGFADVLEDAVDMVALAEYSEELLNKFINPPRELTGTSGKAESTVTDKKQETPTMADEKSFTQEEVQNMLAEALKKNNEQVTNQINAGINNFKKESLKKEFDKLVAQDKMTPAQRDQFVQIADVMGDKEITNADGSKTSAVDFLQSTLMNFLPASNGNLSEHAPNQLGNSKGTESNEFKVERDEIPDSVDQRSYVINKYAEKLMAADKSLKYRDAAYQAEKSPEVAKVLETL